MILSKENRNLYVIAVIINMVMSASLVCSGCADTHSIGAISDVNTKSSIQDMKDAIEKADLLAKIKNIEARQREEERMLIAANDAKLNEIKEQVFPGRKFYFVAAGVMVIFGAMAAFRRSLSIGIAGFCISFALCGIASLASNHPWILWGSAFVGISGTVFFWIQQERKKIRVDELETTAKTLSQAIEVTRSTKAKKEIQKNKEVAEFIEKNTRKYIDALDE